MSVQLPQEIRAAIELGAGGALGIVIDARFDGQCAAYVSALGENDAFRGIGLELWYLYRELPLARDGSHLADLIRQAVEYGVPVRFVLGECPNGHLLRQLELREEMVQMPDGEVCQIHSYKEGRP